jgi:hypothetical protein
MGIAMNKRLAAAVAFALLVPIGAASVAIAWVAASERVGAYPFAGLAPRNSAEAAALANAADLLRFVRSGEDPHTVYPVRPEVISSAILRATAVEAAMWSRQVEMIALLDREGFIREGGERASLACLAGDLRLEDIVKYLAPHGPGECPPGQALARVTMRTAAAGGR